MASTTFEIIRNQDKSVTPTESAQIITYDSGYDGLNSVVVGAVSSGYVGSGITRKGAQTYNPSTSDRTIASGQYLTGDQTIKGMNLEHLSVTISEAATLYTPDTGYDGFDEVSVTGVSPMYVGSMVPRKAAATYHAGSAAQTIDSDQYLTGDQTIEAIALQSKSVVPGGSAQTVTADNGYDGLSSVVVSAITMQSKSVNPSSSQQTIAPDSGYSGLSSVTVGAVSLQTKSVVLGPTIQAIMPDSGYNGLGIVNVPAVALQSKAVNTSSSDQVIQADSGYDGLSSVTVAAVTTSNLSAANIKSGVTVKVGDSGNSGRVASVTGTFYGTVTWNSQQFKLDSSQTLSNNSTGVWTFYSQANDKSLYKFLGINTLSTSLPGGVYVQSIVDISYSGNNIALTANIINLSGNQVTVTTSDYITCNVIYQDK